MIKLVVGVVAGALILGLMGGCGGGDDSSSLTKKEYAKQGSRICARVEGERFARLKVAAKDLKPGETIAPAKLEKVLIDSMPDYRRMGHELEELGAPEGEEAKVEKLVAAIERSADKAEEKPSVAIKNDQAIFGEANEIAEQLELTNCRV